MKQITFRNDLDSHFAQNICEDDELETSYEESFHEEKVSIEKIEKNNELEDSPRTLIKRMK